MKKLSRWMLLCSLLLLSLLPVQAATPSDLTLLADYVSDDVQMFIAFRTDAGYVETLDGIIGRIAAVIPGAGDDNLSTALNNAAAQIEPGSNFRRVVRPWLGDTGAVILADAQSGQAPVFAFSITDTKRAEAFLDKVTTSDNAGATYVKARRRDGVLYTPANRFSPTYRLTDVALLIYTDTPAGLLARNSTSLADSRRFQDALARLPGDDYNILAYLDVLPSLTALGPMLNQQMQAAGLEMFDFTALLRAFGPQVFGFTVEQGRVLTLDIAQSVTDTAAYERGLGMAYTERAALNPDFMQFVPANAALVMHDQDFGASMLLTLWLLETIGEQLDAQYDTTDIRNDELGFLLIDDTVTFLRLTFQGLTGQTLEEGIGWMTGDFAVYLSTGIARNLPTFDAGIIIENTDAAAAKAFFEGQQLALRDLNIYYDEDGDTLIIPGIRQIAASFLPETMANLPLLNNLELALGMNDAVLTFGTRPAAEDVLAGAGGLADNVIFVDAAEHFLPDAESVWYVNFLPLRDVVDFAAETGSRDAESLAQVMSLLESASISQTTTPERRGLAFSTRLVLTLAE
jgi:hypothetical protein